LIGVDGENERGPGGCGVHWMGIELDEFVGSGMGRTRGCVVAADAFMDLLQDALSFFSGNALHEYSRRCAPPVELVSD
jgi:hypothetical protein